MVIRVEISSKEIADLATLIQSQFKNKNATADDVANAFCEGFKDSLRYATTGDSALT